MTEIFAHRGLHVTETENTVRAFVEARDLGVDGVELDVRRTRDGALVIYHDAAIPTLGDISSLACRDLPLGVATLADAMNSCAGMKVNVEIKNDPRESVYDTTGSLAREVVDALNEGGWLDSVIISSFDLATCEAVRATNTAVPVGWLLDWRLDATPAIDEVFARGLTAIHPFYQRVDAALVERSHERGVAVNVWTVNGVDDMVHMLALDVDTLITDDPATALALVRSGRATR